jgi:hypothetical protein
VALLDASEDESVATVEDVPGTLTTTATIPLRSINAISDHIPFIENSRAKVTTEMEAMVLTGLTDLASFVINSHYHFLTMPQNQPLLASSMQTAHNLRVLPELVQNLVIDLSEAVESRIKSAFDLAQISKEIMAKGWPSLLFPSVS